MDKENLIDLLRVVVFFDENDQRTEPRLQVKTESGWRNVSVIEEFAWRKDIDAGDLEYPDDG